MFDRFTDDARRVVVLAQEEARLRNHDFIGVEHLLLAVLRDHDGLAARAVAALGVTPADVRARIDSELGRGPVVPVGHIPFTNDAKQALDNSLRVALELGDGWIGPEHVLLGIVRADGSRGRELLGLDFEAVRVEVVALLRTRGTIRGRVAPRPAPVTWGPHGSPPSACALCGRDLWDVERYVIGATSVCEVCVRDAAAALDRAPGAREVQMPPRPYGEEAPSAEALQEIQDAFTAGFGGDPSLIEDGATLQPFMEQNAALHPGMTATFVVQRVRLVDPDHAEVRFFVLVNPDGYRIQQQGRAVRTNDRWRVARGTAIAILNRGGVAGPPD